MSIKKPTRPLAARGILLLAASALLLFFAPPAKVLGKRQRLLSRGEGEDHNDGEERRQPPANDAPAAPRGWLSGAMDFVAGAQRLLGGGSDERAAVAAPPSQPRQSDGEAPAVPARVIFATPLERVPLTAKEEEQMRRAAAQAEAGFSRARKIQAETKQHAQRQRHAVKTRRLAAVPTRPGLKPLELGFGESSRGRGHPDAGGEDADGAGELPADYRLCAHESAEESGQCDETELIFADSRWAATESRRIERRAVLGEQSGGDDEDENEAEAEQSQANELLFDFETGRLTLYALYEGRNGDTAVKFAKASFAREVLLQIEAARLGDALELEEGAAAAAFSDERFETELRCTHGRRAERVSPVGRAEVALDGAREGVLKRSVEALGAKLREELDRTRDLSVASIAAVLVYEPGLAAGGEREASGASGAAGGADGAPATAGTTRPAAPRLAAVETRRGTKIYAANLGDAAAFVLGGAVKEGGRQGDMNSGQLGATLRGPHPEFRAATGRPLWLRRHGYRRGLPQEKKSKPGKLETDFGRHYPRCVTVCKRMDERGFEIDSNKGLSTGGKTRQTLLSTRHALGKTYGHPDYDHQLAAQNSFAREARVRSAFATGEGVFPVAHFVDREAWRQFRSAMRFFRYWAVAQWTQRTAAPTFERWANGPSHDAELVFDARDPANDPTFHAYREPLDGGLFSGDGGARLERLEGGGGAFAAHGARDMVHFELSNHLVARGGETSTTAWFEGIFWGDQLDGGHARNSPAHFARRLRSAIARVLQRRMLGEPGQGARAAAWLDAAAPDVGADSGWPAWEHDRGAPGWQRGVAAAGERLARHAASDRSTAAWELRHFVPAVSLVFDAQRGTVYLVDVTGSGEGVGAGAAAVPSPLTAFADDTGAVSRRGLEHYSSGGRGWGNGKGALRQPPGGATAAGGPLPAGRKRLGLGRALAGSAWSEALPHGVGVRRVPDSARHHVFDTPPPPGQPVDTRDVALVLCSARYLACAPSRVPHLVQEAWERCEGGAGAGALCGAAAGVEADLAAKKGTGNLLATDRAVQVVWLRLDEARARADMAEFAPVRGARQLAAWVGGGAGGGAAGAAEANAAGGVAGATNGYASEFEAYRAAQRSKCWGKVELPRAEGGENECPQALLAAIDADDDLRVQRVLEARAAETRAARERAAAAEQEAREKAAREARNREFYLEQCRKQEQDRRRQAAAAAAGAGGESAEPLGETERLKQQLAQLTAENEQKEKVMQQTLCVVCTDRPKNTTLMPCRHMCVCEGCKDNLVQNWGGKCPMCREPIQDAVTAYV